MRPDIIGNNRYNVICYEDDLLLTSATSTGFHTLINSCQKYVEEHGLCFNPTKTSCTVIGKWPFTTEATFYIDPSIGCEIAEYKDLHIPGGGARQSIALRTCETANPPNHLFSRVRYLILHFLVLSEYTPNSPSLG